MIATGDAWASKTESGLKYIIKHLQVFISF